VHHWQKEQAPQPNTLEYYIPQDDVNRLLKIKATKDPKGLISRGNIYQVGHYSYPQLHQSSSERTTGVLIFKSLYFTVGIQAANVTFNLVYSMNKTNGPIEAHFTIEQKELLKAVKRFKPLKPRAGDTYFEWTDNKVLFHCASKDGVVSTITLNTREQLNDLAKFGFNLSYLAHIAKMNGSLTIDLIGSNEGKHPIIKIREVAGPKEVYIAYSKPNQ
jgi:azurin